MPRLMSFSMRLLRDVLADVRGVGWVWLALLALTAAVPPIVLAMPLVQRHLVDSVLLAGRIDRLVPALALYAALWFTSNAAHVAVAALRSYLSERLALRLRQRLFDHSVALSVAFAHRTHTGQTLALFASDVPIAAGLSSMTVLALFSSLVSLATGVILMFGLSWQLALAAGIAPLLTAAAVATVTRPLKGASLRVRDKLAQLTEQLHENLTGMREIVAFGRGGDRRLRFGAALLELLRLRMRVVWIDSAIGAGQGLFSLLVTLAILGFGGYLVLQGRTTLGTLVAMQSLFGHVLVPTQQLAGLVTGVQKALASRDRVAAFLAHAPRVEDHANARSLPSVAGAVAFEHVGFAYEPGRPVLADVTFSAAPGEIVALVGPSGAGKSSLVSLLARFYDPTGGRVLLDGVDLRHVTLADLRRHIGFVFQDSFLFATTIRENIALGRDGASESEIVSAATAARAWEFIERLPQGLDTHVGERGVQLSEGQRQRIAIARALLCDPRVLILDEPTSALDARSERLLQEALDSVMLGRTTFVVAHRLATVRRAHRILVLDQGRLVEQGTHEELLHRLGLYRELHDLQLAGMTAGLPAAHPGVDRALRMSPPAHAPAVAGLAAVGP
ncbi:MAG TPA: ABC transporter ATP-binding protein [Chloroflexota bacterium]|nr:ABC transporter ATP-binding protein [Chloroflexota bacterium]